MSLTNSPKFEDEFENAPLDPSAPSGGEPDQPPPTRSKRRTRILIGVLAALVLVSGLLLVANRRANPASVNAGSATIHGQVVNPQGAAVSNASVYVEGMESSVTTDASGAFSISGAPGGQVVIVVGVTPESPQFVTVNVGANDTNDVGQIVYQVGS